MICRQPDSGDMSENNGRIPAKTDLLTGKIS